MTENFEGATRALREFAVAKVLLNEGAKCLLESGCDRLFELGKVVSSYDSLLELAIKSLNAVKDGGCPRNIDEELTYKATVDAGFAEFILKKMQDGRKSSCAKIPHGKVLTGYFESYSILL